ncbi:hypothetical protein [Aliarcobacter skirrowii]|uniref:hypothetical protein n=1 Tax=Aliarcobacter skirrowii TaxID=28200 RepID=UPI0029A07E54|nr:hypothetical protein [Aliarcobacter skirrowii]MDX4028342.1 hypothetical protein [Aliarcobacter skirrowii]
MDTVITIDGFNMAIKVDEDNKELLSYDLRDNIVIESSEGILKEVNQELYNALETHLNINPNEYGIEINNEEVSLQIF